MNKKSAIEAHVRARDLSQTRHQFAHQDVSDGQGKICDEHMRGLRASGAPMASLGDFKKAIVGYDGKPTPGWTRVGVGICILSGLSVLGVGYGVWLLIAPYVTAWWLG